MGCTWCSSPLILHLGGSGEDSDEAIGASPWRFWGFGDFQRGFVQRPEGIRGC